jgi:hypothetical protein
MSETKPFRIERRSVMEGYARLKECGLEMHAEKTKIVYCKDSNRGGTYPNVQFDFLGYAFKPRMAQNSIRKVWFTNWLPAVSDNRCDRCGRR